MDLKRKNKGQLSTNPLINSENHKKSRSLNFRRNIKLPDNVFYRLKALQKVTPYKQYELIEQMTNLMVNSLSERDKEYFVDQLSRITEFEEKKRLDN